MKLWYTSRNGLIASALGYQSRGRRIDFIYPQHMIFFPPALCFVWHLGIFPTQNNSSFISFIYYFLLYFTKMNCWSKRLIPERTSARIAVPYKGRWLYVGPWLKTIFYLWFMINISTVTVPTFNSCTKCLGTIHDCKPACHQFHWHRCKDRLKIERDFDSQTTWVIDVLGLYFDTLSTGAFTTRHWQTTGRLVQELNVHTVWSWEFFKIIYSLMDVSNA